MKVVGPVLGLLLLAMPISHSVLAAGSDVVSQGATGSELDDRSQEAGTSHFPYY